MAATTPTTAAGTSSLPQANPALVQALTNPAYLQGTSGYTAASYNPSTYTGTGYHAATGPASQLSQSLLQMLSPNATIAQLQKSMVPQTQQAWQGLNQQLADFGVGGGQAIQAGDQLSGQLTASLGPAMAAAIQNAQANSLGAGEFNTGALNQMEQFNNANRNAARQFTSGEQNQARAANANAFNTAGQFNAGAANTANQFDASAQNNMNAMNVGIQNQEQQALLDAILGNYSQQQNAMTGFLNTGQQGLTQQGLNTGQTITQNPGIFGDIMGLAGAAAPFFTGGFGGGGGAAGGSGYGSGWMG